MRKKRDPETQSDRSDRLEKIARARLEQASAEEQALDAAVRRSIRQYGA